MKKKPCKHLYFIATQVAQNEELVNYFKNDTKISENAYKVHIYGYCVDFE